MRCPPCHTPMQLVDYTDGHEEFPLVWMRGWRCSRCGYAINPLAEFNRRFLAFEVWPVEQDHPLPVVQDDEYGQDCAHPLEIPHLDHGSGAPRW